MERESVPRLKIREGTPDDTVSTRMMQAESWLATYPNEEAGVPYTWVKARTDSWLRPEALESSRQLLTGVLSDPTMFYRLAEIDGEVVGFIHVMTNNDGTKHLEAIYTSPETFHSGLGQQLMELADEWIDGAVTTLQVASYNDRAIRFYEKNGFVRVAGSEAMYREMIPIIEMKRQGVNYEI